MVDGMLYLWARNAGNAQLAWSADHGATWTWADWKFTTSFGCPTFLNFGRNYAGARDEFVYVYSHDADSAYSGPTGWSWPACPRTASRERAAYEFFQQLDARGEPVWTKDIARRGAVLTSPGRCYRSSVSYNAGLQALPVGARSARRRTRVSPAAWPSTTHPSPGDRGPPSSPPTPGMSARAKPPAFRPSGSAPTAARCTWSSPAKTVSPSGKQP